MSMYRIYLVKSDSEEFTFPQTNKEHGEEVREIMEFEATEAEAKDAFFAAASKLDERIPFIDAVEEAGLDDEIPGGDDELINVRSREGTFDDEPSQNR